MSADASIQFGTREVRMARVLDDRNRYHLSNKKLILARRLARDRQTPSQVAEAVGWPGSVNAFVVRMRKHNIVFCKARDRKMANIEIRPTDYRPFRPKVLEAEQ